MGQWHRVSDDKQLEITKACAEGKLSLVNEARLAGTAVKVHLSLIAGDSGKMVEYWLGALAR